MARAARRLDFFSPWALGAVLVLVLNDHFLKWRFHNALTGKLSDFAGCFFLPLYVAAFLEWLAPTRSSHRARVLIGVALTLALFVPIKLSSAAADVVAVVLETLARPFGGGAMHIVADPTDLFAVSMVAVAAWFALRVPPQEQRS